MTDNSSKQKIINDIYFDRAGFGSKKTTLEDAKKKDPTIKMTDVEEFFKKNVEVKKKPRGWNSFVAPYNNHTYQVDIFFISKKDLKAKQKFRGGLVAIDVLSKYAVVVPVRMKETGSVIKGTKEAIQKMGKKPEIIEGSLEAKLPTIWRDGNGTARKKLGRGESQKGEDKRWREKMQVHEKVGKSRNTVFFQCFVAPEGRKVGSLKQRVRR